MATLRKMFGGGKKSAKEKENSQPQKKQEDDIPDHGLSQEEVQDLNLPIPKGKRDRNLSISRSGRHKLRNKGRSSIMNDGFYAKTASESSPTSPTSPTSPVAKSSKTDVDTKHAHAQNHDKSTAVSSSHGSKISPHNSVSNRHPSKSTPPSNCRNVGVTNNRLQGSGSALPSVSQTTAV